MRTLRTEGDEGVVQKEELTTRLIEKNNVLQREREELEAKLEKLRISSDKEISLEKKQHEKTILELSRVKHENRELVKQVQHLENHLQLKEKDIEDLKSRLDMKNVLDQKHSNREAVLFQNFIGKSPTPSNAYDVKVMSFIKVYQDQKEQLEEGNRNLKKEVEKLRNDLTKSEEAAASLEKGLDQNQDKRSKEISNRIEIVESENKGLAKDNQLLRERLEKLDNENVELKKKFEELKNKYYAIDVGTPNKAETKFGMNFTPQANTMKSTKSFTTSKKPDMKTTDREGKFFPKQQAGEFELSPTDSKKLIAEILEIYQLQSPVQILNSIKKTEKVMHALPKLQRLLAEITSIVCAKVDSPTNEPPIEQIIPTLKIWITNLEETEDLRRLRAKLIERMGLVKDSDPSDILKCLDDLLYTSFQFHDLRVKTQKDTSDNSESRMIVEQLTKILGHRPTVHQMKQMVAQLSDLRNFITLVKNKLDLDPHMSNEACLTRLLKTIDNPKKDAYIVSALQRILDCDPNHIIDEVENLKTHQRNPLSYTYQRHY